MAQEKAHILLIEDDTFLASIYQKKFEMEGFKMSVAENGEKGLQDAKKKKPDLILLDILLPKMDGFTVLEKNKSRSGGKKCSSNFTYQSWSER
jgi:DNA-binding response OmpR family regulator